MNQVRDASINMYIKCKQSDESCIECGASSSLLLCSIAVLSELIVAGSIHMHMLTVGLPLLSRMHR
jgi:hypothetical protein